MNKLIHIIILLIYSNLTFGQGGNCGCFDGIGSTKQDRPSLTMDFKNGRTITVCGYEQEKYSSTKIKMSEFNVFDCMTKKPLTEFGALQTCEVEIKNDTLTIIELKYLPVGRDWQWKFIPIGRQRIFPDRNQLQVSTIKPFYQSEPIRSELKSKFFQEIEQLKGKGYNDQFDNIIGKLEVLALNGNERAQKILTDFESYFNFPPDGAIAEQLKDAIATVDWIKNKEKSTARSSK